MTARRFINNLIVATVALVLLPLTACVYDYYPDENPADGPADGRRPVVYLTLTVNPLESDVPAPVSRAGETYYYEEPLLQNEKLNDLRVFILDKATKEIEAHRKVTYSRQGVLQSSNLTFKLPTGTKTIYLIGNESSLPDAVKATYMSLTEGDIFPADDINGLILQRASENPFFTANDDIPMTETAEVTLESSKTSDSDAPTYVYKSLFVTRIATKYTVTTPIDMHSLSVRLHDIATSQYLMPNGVTYYPAKDLPEETINGVSGRTIVAFQAPPTATKANFEIALTDRSEIVNPADGKKYYRYQSFYLMETAGDSFQINAQIDADPVLIDALVPQPADETASGEEWPKYIEFTGKWFDSPQTFSNLPLLPRNTHVVVNISANYEPQAVVDVVPYRGCVLDPVFGLDR